MTFIAIGFGIIAVIFAILFFKQRYTIKKAAKDLEQLNQMDTNQKLRFSNPDKTMEQFIAQINTLLSQKQQQEITYMRTEKEYREQFANISHDLRTPLTSILGYIELMKDTAISEQDRNTYLNIVQTRSKVLQDLVSGVYDLSRLEAKEYQFQFTNVNLYSILSELMVAFYNDFEAKGITVTLELEEIIPPIIADAQAVTRIFTNLIQNVLKHGVEKIFVEQKVIEGRIVTRIANDTKSFQEQDIDLVFDRFFTSDRMRTGQNTGLGLSIVKRLVNQMGYSIKAMMLDDFFVIEIDWTSDKR